jgi:hypothetical protein
VEIIKVEKGLTTEEILKKLEKKIPISLIVKINKKYYQRVRPIKNKWVVEERKFIEIDNTPVMVILTDEDGDKVRRIAEYKVEFK